MSIVKPMTLSLAAAIIFATAPAPSFAATYELSEGYVSSSGTSSANDDDGGSIWDFIMDLLW